MSVSFQSPTLVTQTAVVRWFGSEGDTKESQHLGTIEAQSGHLSAVVVSSLSAGLGEGGMPPSEASESSGWTFWNK